MKKLYKLFMGIGCAAMCLVSFTGCIDETEPTSIATKEQAQRENSATEATLMGLHAYLNQMDESLVDNYTHHGAFGYPAMMLIRDFFTGDAGFSTTSYMGHFSWASRNKYLGDSYLYMQYVWNYYYGLVLSANTMVGMVDPDNASEEQIGYLGAGYAFRALAYLDMARMYEFLPNDKTSNINALGNDVLNLTVPIVTEKITEEEAGDNPRATRQEMFDFILSDLDKAEEYIVNLEENSAHILPTLACVYGLKARLYMWVEDYPNAEKYARLAIDNEEDGPIDEATALSIATGYNVSSEFMWGAQQTKEDASVQSGIVNFASWISNQSTFGYTGAATGSYVVCDKNFYDRISDTDWRKLEFKCPAGSELEEMLSYVNPALGARIPAYAALKFRPGSGDIENYSVGAATGYPIMRVEEMYFIEAEAAAHQNAARGKQLVEDFMQNYRDENYTCDVTATDDVVEEIVFQKRVEQWGEGQTFFDIKRLNYSVTRGYPGTPFFATMRLNTNGRPAWMNCVMVRNEGNSNKAVKDWNNPDPSDVYDVWQ